MDKNMKQSYLIQRLKKPTGANPFSFGGGLKNGGINQKAFDQLNKIFSFDYMGAAEFEFGALPETLQKINDHSSEFISGSTKVSWRMDDWKTKEKSSGKDEVYYICHKDHEEEVKKRIAIWAIGKKASYMNLKERVRLNESFKEDMFKGWLEFDNGFFFFIDKKMWKNTIELFEIKKD